MIPCTTFARVSHTVNMSRDTVIRTNLVPFPLPTAILPSFFVVIDRQPTELSRLEIINFSSHTRTSVEEVGNIVANTTMIRHCLVGQPLHKEEGSGTAALLELFCWNAINIRELVFSYARFMLCGDTLTTAHGLHTGRSAR